nr:hypothetical protein [Streptomyces murinus]
MSTVKTPYASSGATSVLFATLVVRPVTTGIAWFPVSTDPTVNSSRSGFGGLFSSHLSIAAELDLILYCDAEQRLVQLGRQPVQHGGGVAERRVVLLDRRVRRALVHVRAELRDELPEHQGPRQLQQFERVET